MLPRGLLVIALAAVAANLSGLTSAPIDVTPTMMPLAGTAR